ncbi:MAG: transposase [Deltaproteobacteria bacterium]|nr:transposase [Deltaproteobacteria bacterium]
MRKSRFSDQQIAPALQQVEHGASVAEVCRRLCPGYPVHKKEANVDRRR